MVESQEDFLSKSGILATPGGFEPPTNSLEGCCSNPLSYGAAKAIG
jgi:hypothetical protein